uniref:NACHT domain-containing protein n=1 Tax=Anopheles maculatus TaxID=74869 RepID=A0A182SQH3_9DIPT
NLCNKDKKQHLNKVPAHKANIKIDRASYKSAGITTAADEKILAKFEQKVYEFYDKFLLVCGSSNEEDLRPQALTLLPKCCNVDPGTAFEKFQGQLLEAMKNSEQPFSFDPHFVTACFAKLELDQRISNLIDSSRDYVESLHTKQRHIQVHPERLKQSPLWTFLGQATSHGVFEFNTSLALTVSARILIQILSASNYETVFVHGTNPSQAQSMKKRLHELLQYLNDGNHATIKLVTILGKQDHDFIGEIKNLAEKHCFKICIVQQSDGTPPPDQRLERFSVKDLTRESFDELYKQPERNMFGTVASLRRVVDDTDDLSFLLALLELCDDRSSVIWDHNLNEHSYQKIKRWYIHRQCVPYEQTLTWRREDYIASYSAFEIDRALASNDEQPEPPKLPNGKVCVFLNDAGHGKTSYFSWLAWRLASSEPAPYVIKLIALEFSTDFEQLQQGPGPQTLTDTDILRLLYRYIHLALFVPSVNKRTVKETDVYRAEADRCAQRLTITSTGQIILDTNATEGIELSPEQLIELRLFREKFNERKLVLILDGFDEIAPHYKEGVLSCFARFVQLDGVQSLYLSSRPYGFEEDLKKTFHQCHLYKLAPFSKYNIILSFHNFLLRRLDGYEHYEPRIGMDILRELYDSIFFRLNDIVTVPLLLYMVQTVLLPDIRQRVSEHSHTITASLLRNAQLADMELVERFVDRKMQISNIDKTGTT